MTLVIQLALCLGAALVCSELAYRLRYPRMLGVLIAGALLSVPALQSLFTEPALESIATLSDLGIIFLLLLAGMEINLTKLEKSTHDSLIVSFFCVLVPFLLGFGAVMALQAFGLLGVPNPVLVAALVGSALALTAEGITIDLLMEMNVLNTRLGTLLLGAGLLDDMFGVVVLSVIVMLLQDSFASLAFFPLLIIGFVLVVFGVVKATPRLIKMVQREHSRIATVSTMIVITLAIAGVAQLFGLSPIVGAFLAGVIIQWANKDRYDEQQDVKELRVIAFSLIVPFFFINIGLHLDLASLWTNPVLFLAILCAGLFGKLLGALAATPLAGLSLAQGVIVGWGMNSRGALELVIAELARSNGLISTEIYSAIVAMSVITTFLFPFMLRRMLRTHPHAMQG